MLLIDINLRKVVVHKPSKADQTMPPFKVTLQRFNQPPSTPNVLVWEQDYSPTPRTAVITEASWGELNVTFTDGDAENKIINKETAGTFVLADAQHPLANKAIDFMRIQHYFHHLEMADGIFWQNPELTKDLLTVFNKHNFDEKIKSISPTLRAIGALSKAEHLLSTVSHLIDNEL